MGDEILTVKDMIEFLQKFDLDLPFGYVGHYGEFHSLNRSDFWKSKTYLRSYSSSEKRAKEFEALVFQAPDVGPEPD